MEDYFPPKAPEKPKYKRCNCPKDCGGATDVT